MKVRINVMVSNPLLERLLDILDWFSKIHLQYASPRSNLIGVVEASNLVGFLQKELFKVSSLVVWLSFVALSALTVRIFCHETKMLKHRLVTFVAPVVGLKLVLA